MLEAWSLLTGEEWRLLAPPSGAALPGRPGPTAAAL